MSKLGYMSAEKTDKNGKRFFDLEINLPFCVKMKFFVTENGQKHSPDGKHSSPDFYVYYATNRVGAIWKKISKNSQEFLSAEIVAPSFPDGKLKFALFLNKEDQDTYNVIVSTQRERGDEVTEEVPY
ncbi:DUF736 family protein [Leptospira santarosai]|uniref:DUF736 domain-containing protein n=1 Tax=Leptospira santarosai serovar Shermani str. LT 821 TaxID=758847 RepID=K8XW64_9LEPT|nr:DUF736 family protein [Leptospira santarosai]EKT85146.1 hypothetical protein LSS_19108 [Leptospira santarosai serovar Shermani str. LT 821]EMO85975.1 PF05284 family protein [Leptospira santarosai str. AIM]EPG83743.1 PF05284 family protein [Leptospira santarosai serovar Shermani str. 1342KT]